MNRSTNGFYILSLPKRYIPDCKLVTFYLLVGSWTFYTWTNIYVDLLFRRKVKKIANYYTMLRCYSVGN